MITNTNLYKGNAAGGLVIPEPTNSSKPSNAKRQSLILVGESIALGEGVIPDPVKISKSIDATWNSSIKLSNFDDSDLDGINSKSKDEVANSECARKSKVSKDRSQSNSGANREFRRWSLFSCFRGRSTSNRGTNRDSSWSFFDYYNRRQISGNSAVSENVREQNQETVEQAASSIRSSLQSCLPSLPSINFPRVNCPAVALPSMDHVADGCERFTSCLGTVGNGLATAAGYAGEALLFIGQSAGPVCLGLIRFVGCIGRIACCLLTGGASESHE